MLADPMGWLSAETKAMFQRPPVVDRAGRRQAARRRRGAAHRRAGAHRRPRSGAHRGVGRLPAARGPGGGPAGGDAVRRPALRGLASGAPTCPGAITPPCCAAWPRRSCRCATRCSCCPATARRPRSAASGSTNPFLQDLPTCRRRRGGCSRWQHASPRCPASRSGCPASASSSSTSWTPCARSSSCTVSRRSRPARSSRWSSCCARARSTRRSTSCAGCRPTTADAEADRARQLGLHFDLTVPLARYVLENAGHLEFPFRRYQIQKAWRGERPQEGRYREFTQADIDVIGRDTLAFHHEVEVARVMAEALPGCRCRRCGCRSTAAS